MTIPHDWLLLEIREFLTANKWECEYSSEIKQSQLGPYASQTWVRSYGHVSSELHINYDGDCELRPIHNSDMEILTCRLRVLRGMLRRWGGMRNNGRV